jgi:hypothetical protein
MQINADARYGGDLALRRRDVMSNISDFFHIFCRIHRAGSHIVRRQKGQFTGINKAKSAGRRRSGWAPRGAYQIIRRLPPKDGEFQYVIRSAYEDHHRVAKEGELSRN